jgi:hypothetical protein
VRHVLVVPIAVLVFSCTHRDSNAPSEPRPSASASATVTTPAPSAPTRAGNERVQPVYALDGGPEDLRAERLCETLQRVPEHRKDECCAARSAFTSALANTQCVRTLSGALRSGAVSLADADIDRCAEAMTRATAGCDWITPETATGAMPLPTECNGVLQGNLPEEASCRSSLECSGSLRCQGLSAVDVGTCGRPKPTKSACNLASDTLAIFTRQEPLEETHPECSGYCDRRQCADAVPTGGACKLDVECGQWRCERGACVTAQLPGVGEACSATCVAGARCVKGTCTLPAAEGAACEVDSQCRGVCVHDAAGAGSCTRSCPKKSR